MVLLRRLLGDVLRRHRVLQARTLRDVSAAAGVSLGYLSEIERGRKEASSELLAAICTALDVSLSEVLREAGDDLAREERRRRLVPVGFGRASRPVPVRPASSHLVAGRSVASRPPMARPVAGVAPISPSRPERPGSVPAKPVASLQSAVVVAA
jgi:transcriptional regulator with XRE-family HTH domain